MNRVSTATGHNINEEILYLNVKLQYDIVKY